MARSLSVKGFARKEAAFIIRRVRKFARAGECERADRELRMLTKRIHFRTHRALRKTVDRCFFKYDAD